MMRSTLQDAPSSPSRTVRSPLNTPRNAPPQDKARRAAARASLLAHLPLLRHLACGHGIAKTALAQSGLLEALRTAWRAIVVQDALALEALHLLGALLADCFDARHALCAVGRPPLLLRTLRVIFRCVPHDTSAITAPAIGRSDVQQHVC
jgi:hypothetical protein